MRTRSRWCGRGAVAGLVAVFLAGGAAAGGVATAQTLPPSGGARVEGDPFTCWWKADARAVLVGERFSLVLTCAALETGRITAVPDLATIEPASIKIPPFEVVSGTAQQDVRDGPWRYIQREYVVRLVGDAFFGKDADIPSVLVSYTIRSVGEGGGTEGRSQAYVLPPLPVRVLSLVPQKASDIQDSARDTFSAVEARRRRATNELVAAGILLSFAVVMLGVAAVRALRGRFGDAPAKATPHLSPRGLLGGSARALSALKAEVVREGWSVERASRALTVFRVAAAVALGRPVTQTLEADARVEAREGQLALRTGIWRRRRVMVSAATTPTTIARELAAGLQPGVGARVAQPLSEIRELLGVFGAARYGRDAPLDSTALDEALDAGGSAVRRLRSLGTRRQEAFQPHARVARGGRA